MSIFDALFGSAAYKNPAESAMPYLQQIPGTITPYYQPYVDTGTQAMQDFYKQISQMSASPQDYYNQLAAGYTQSPGYQYSVDQATKAANQNAAAGGMFGTPAEQEAIAQQTAGLASQDFNNYMNQILGIGQTGLKGEEYLTGVGYKSSSELASDLAKNLMSQAGLEYKGAQGENMYNAQQQSQMMQMLGSALAAAASMYG